MIVQPTPTCPNTQWKPNSRDVEFTDATMTLLEAGSCARLVISGHPRLGFGPIDAGYRVHTKGGRDGTRRAGHGA